MAIDILIGLQWGDEGKGKIVDVLSHQYELVARFQGGPNAGHTLALNGKKYVLHSIPSGIFHEKTMNLIGSGVVIDPVIFKQELEKLKKDGIDPVAAKKLVIAKKSHLILPTHQLLDAASERNMGTAKIGSTLKGIGPTYMDKTGRNGLRVGDICLPSFREKYQYLVNKHQSILQRYGTIQDFSAKEKEFFDAITYLQSIPQVDGEHFINRYIKSGKPILAEGAQGTMLDVDFGTYPYVTSSHTIAAGACIGLGVAPKHVGDVIGVFKAYCTRVGSGPFPTELTDHVGENLRQLGKEFGATTGRPRRCGWVDLPALRYAIMLNGVTELVMTKVDVLNSFSKIYVCTHYRYKGEVIDYMPYDIQTTEAEPMWTAIDGWQKDLSNVSSPSQLPKNLQTYVGFLEKELSVPIKYLSVGPDRLQTLTLC